MKSKLSFAAILLTAAMFASCSLETGLFYSIYSETPVGDPSLPGGISSFSLTTGTDNVRLLAAGGLYIQSGNDDWSTILPAGMESSIAQTVLFLDPDYYVFFSSIDGSGGTLYKTADPAAVDISLEEVDIPGISSLVHVISAEGSLFIVSGTSGSYSVGMYDGSTYTEVLSGLDSLRRSFDVAFDGTSYHLTWGDALYSGTAGSALTPVDLTGSGMTLAGGDYFGGIHFDDNLYISLNSIENGGSVWKNDGTSWSSVTADLNILHDFCSYTTGSSDLILVGSDEGYYESLSGTAGFVTPEVSCDKTAYLSTALSNAAVMGFHDSGDALYSLTLNSGLWKNSGDNWTRE